MKTLIFSFLAVFLLARTTLFAQKILCGTPQDSRNQKEYQFKNNDVMGLSGTIKSAAVPTPPITVTVVFHIFNNTVASSDTDRMLTTLNNSFNVHHINFVKLCDDFIPSSADPNAIDLPYAINIYIYESLSAPYAKAVGSNALYIGKSQSNTSSLPHEMGHCLNLFHTHNEGGCIEMIDGSNCTICGDYICDTPADPNLYQGRYLVDNNCNYIGTVTQNGVPYNPDTHNFMSYSIPSCRNHFTPGQGTRMYNSLGSLNVLIPVTKPAEIQESTTPPNQLNLVCSSTTYSFKALSTSIVSWSSSNPAGLNIIQQLVKLQHKPILVARLP